MLAGFASALLLVVVAGLMALERSLELLAAYDWAASQLGGARDSQAASR